MDSGGHSHPPSSVQAAFHKSSPLVPPEDVSTPPSRQQRLLRARNARFSAKRISISGISARFSDMIKTSDDRGRLPPPLGNRNQENESSTKRRALDPAAQAAAAAGVGVGAGASSSSSSPLGILGEISSSVSGRLRPRQKRPSIPIFQDSIDGSLPPQHSRGASPTVYQDPPSPVCTLSSPGNPHDSFATMGLKEISGNARKSPATDSPGLLSTAAHHPASYHISRFNPEQYIEHLEKHLELVKNDAYSPESNRPWKDKLKAADAEKERLKAEARQMKAAFEAELQKTVEHMTATEVELQRKIRSLEDDLDQKNVIIQELEMQHEERRLDQSTVDTLRSTIDKLEQEKRSLEQCNESISRRNEALTQLLAISPTKTRDPVNGSSPARVRRRKARPQSLIIARTPSSPDAALWASSRPFGPSTSPAPSARTFSSRHAAQSSIAPFHLSRGIDSDISLDLAMSSSVAMGPPSRVNSCRSPTRSSTSGSPPLDAFVNQNQHRPHSKHRARRFLQGSTQLKPLLLPFLMGDNGVPRTALPLTPPRPQSHRFSQHSIDSMAMPLLHPSSPTQTLAVHAPSESLDDATRACFGSAAGRRLSHPISGMEDKDELDGLSDWSYSSVQEQLEHALRRKIDSLMSPAGSRSSSPEEEGDKTIISDQQQQQPSLTCDSLPDLSSSVEVPLPLFSPSARHGTASRRRLQRRHWSAHRTTPPGRSCEDEMKNEVGIEPETPCQKRRNRRRSSLSFDGRESLSSYKTSQENDFDACTTPVASTSQARKDEYQSIAAAAAATAASLSLSPPGSGSGSGSGSPSSTPPIRPQSPLEVLYKGGVARSLTDSTLKAICGAWSKYVKCFAVIKRSTLDLARRVIANAWRGKWAFCGMLSWWVLGLFIGPSWRQSQPLRWEKKTKSAAEAELHGNSGGGGGGGGGSDSNSSHDTDTDQERSRKAPPPPPPPPLKSSSSPGWTQSLLLWGKFSIAIMMAVGGAVVQGPAEMLREAEAEAEERTAARHARKKRQEEEEEEEEVHVPEKKNKRVRAHLSSSLSSSSSSSSSNSHYPSQIRLLRQQGFDFHFPFSDDLSDSTDELTGGPPRRYERFPQHDSGGGGGGDSPCSVVTRHFSPEKMKEETLLAFELERAGSSHPTARHGLGLGLGLGLSLGEEEDISTLGQPPLQPPFTAGGDRAEC